MDGGRQLEGHACSLARFNQVAEKLEAEKKLNSSDETAPREGETKIDHENVERPIADEKSTPCSPQHVHSPLLASSDSLPCPPQRLEFVQASLLRLNSSYEYFVMGVCLWIEM